MLAPLRLPQIRMHVPARTRLRLVLDTNVWLDWLVFGDPSVAPIRAAVAASRAEIFIDAACEAELERALGYDLGKKFTVDAQAQGACLAECRRLARRIDSPVPEAERSRLPACRDPDDQKFMEAALAARAGFLVTKDRALLDLAPRVASFRILTPEAFEKADPSLCSG
jgi:putative PIN family toxin of toxin-antitoxin system